MQEWAGIVVPSLVSIVGFLVTYFMSRKNLKDGLALTEKEFQNELLKQRSDKRLELMASAPYDALVLMQDMIDSGKNKKHSFPDTKLLEKQNNLYFKVYAYGSPSSLHILSSMQSENYQANMNSIVSVNAHRLICYYVLLASQLRMDVTGETVNPEEWFKMKFSDYHKTKSLFADANNQLVTELNLSKDFFIR
ncbi:hypothetical protein [Enteroscipio rubneri]|uniref:DUF4760 domain-containing protein n=1 Tax=Enteroscipio rubneri TaxID=2070686 RepID=A0A2K2U973_9ACTN|nr:hypothetical protein [Enteroscipio rubneri]PNV66873.1 hypothetical protein C2L71_10815 [Enteroscipio rubneri]